MTKIRVLFGDQIRLDYGDPQPIALGGRLVAVAEIAPELLNHVLNLRGPQAVNTWPIVAKPLALRYRNSGPSEATIMDALLVMHQDEPLPPLCNGERYPGGARLGHGSMGETVKVSFAIAHANKCCRSKTRVLVKYIPISVC